MSYTPTCATPDHSILSVKIELSDFNRCISSTLKHIANDDNRMNKFPYIKKCKVDNIPNDFMNNTLPENHKVVTTKMQLFRRAHFVITFPISFYALAHILCQLEQNNRKTA